MTTSTTPESISVELNDTGDVVAAIPHLVGFRPTNSLVLVAQATRRATRVGLVVRVDIPRLRADERGLADHLARVLKNNRVAAVTAVVVGIASGTRGGDPRRLVHARLVDTLRAAFGREGIALAEAVWVARVERGARWHCYADPAHTGTLPDPDTSVLAASAVAAGMTTYDDRDGVGEQLRPADPAAVSRRASLLDARSAAGSYPDTADSWNAVCVALARAADDPQFMPCDEDAVTLGLALTDGVVRQACFALAVPPATPRAHAAERLWLALVRGLPAPERGEAACLLGYGTWLHGNGVLAGMALDTALEADPGHSIAAALRLAYATGMPPDKLPELAEDNELPLPDEVSVRPPAPG